MTLVLVYMKVNHCPDFLMSPSFLLPVKNNPSSSRSGSLLLVLVQGMFFAQPTSPKNQIQH